MTKNCLKILPILLLATSIAISPSFSLGKIEGERMIEIRIEDILLAVLGILWLISFLVKEKSAP